MIEAKIICDSMSPDGKRLTTFQLRYPRFIHAEELTHRILSTTPEGIFYEAIADGFMYDRNLSRNASSSRAIPVNRMIEDLRRDPVMPMYWGSNKPGMQAGEELTGDDLEQAKLWWMTAMNGAIAAAENMIQYGLHKQIANRILEPWAHINVVVTATEWNNFWVLRRHPDAQPEIKELADQMYLAMVQSIPAALDYGAWHLPFIRDEDWVTAVKHLQVGRITRDMPNHTEQVELLKKVSTARCGRVSYLTHDGRETTVEEDFELFQRLVGGQPLHASPAEHQATPDSYNNLNVAMEDGTVIKHEDTGWSQPHLHGNFVGWIQHRKLLDGEYVAG